MSLSNYFRGWSLGSGRRTRRGRRSAAEPRTLRAETLETRRLLAADPIVQNPMGVLALDDGDPQPDAIELLHEPGVQDGVFFDADLPGDDLTFTIVNNTNPELVTAGIANDELSITYISYNYEQDRTPALITVRATDSAGGFVDDTLEVVVLPQTTIELHVVVRGEATPENEFTFFAATPGASSPDPLGTGRFQLDGGNLIYELTEVIGVDFDGNKTPGVSSDNVTGLSFRDASDGGALAFNILADNDLTIDHLLGDLSGVWESGAEGMDNFVDQLYAGSLFVLVTTEDDPTGVKIGDANIDVSPELAVLPPSLSSAVPGATYVVEVWATDTLPGSTGFTSVFVDMNFDPQLSTGNPNTIGSGNPFDLFPEGEVDNNSGTASLGGGTVFADVGRSPSFARLGYVEFTADETGLQSYELDVTLVDRQGGPNVHSSQFGVHNADVRQSVQERDKIGVFRDGNFYLDANGNGRWNERAGGDTAYRFGTVGDVPVIGDWDGDGYDNLGVFRPSNRFFFLDLNGNNRWDGVAGGDGKFRFGGQEHHIPVVGDWNNDGVDEIGRYGHRFFFVDLNGNGRWDKIGGGDMVYAFGAPGDLPASGDFNNDGIDDVGVYRPSNGKFYFDTNGNHAWDSGTDAAYAYRGVDESPLVGNWTGLGTDKIATHSGFEFYLDFNPNGIWDEPAGGDAIFKFAAVDDIPIAGAWAPAPANLVAASSAPAGTPAAEGDALTDAALDPVIQSAVDIWSAGALSSVQQLALGQLDVRIADLPGNVLGQAVGSTVTIDVNAAGWGWSLGQGSRVESPGPDVFSGQMDLLSVALHEIGHVLGFDDVDGEAGGVMSDSLEAGVRRELSDAERDQLFTEL